MTIYRNHFLIITSLMLFLSNSTGFDFYSHVVSYYLLDQQINYSSNFFEIIILPRYLFLSVIYEFFSRIEIPIGYAVVFLILFPTYHIFSNSYFTNQKNYTIDRIVLILIIFYLSFFYSATSISILWLIACLITKKKIFLIGGLFHTTSIVIYSIFFFLINIRLLYWFVFVYLGLFLLLMFYLSEYKLLDSVSYNNFKYNINFDNIYNLSLLIIKKKTKEFVLLLILILLVYVNKKAFFKFKNNNLSLKNKSLSLDRMFFSTSIFISLIVLFYYMSDKTGLIRYLLFSEQNKVVYIAWFDFGLKDFLNLSFTELTCERYNNC